MVTDEHHFDAFVVTAQEQVEQNVEALGQILGGLGHGAGDIHQAEHHCLGRRRWLLDDQVVAQVEGVEKGNAFDACLEAGNFLLQLRDTGNVIRMLTLELLQLGACLAQPLAAAARECDAPCLRRAHGPYDIDPRGVALLADAGADRLEGVCAGQLALDQVWQGEILEHEVEEFVLGYLKDELIHAFAAVARLTAALAPTATLRAGDAVAGGELAVTGVHLGLATALAMVKNRLVDVAVGDADAFAVLYIGDRTTPHGLFNRLLDV